jgi:cell division protein FtsW
LLPLASLRISGRHNAANALATLALGDALRLPIAPMLDELREFTGLPHRAQWVAEIKGVRYINDSKGTNVGATLAAVGGLVGPLVVIAGGDGKGQDFSPLAAAFRGKVRTAVLLGRDAGLIETALAGICHTARAATMTDAVSAARASRRPATPCCCRRRVRASTCFATTPNAAACSPPRSWSSHEAGRPPAHRCRGAVAGVGHRAARSHHGHLGVDLDRQPRWRQCVFVPRTPAGVVLAWADCWPRWCSASAPNTSRRWPGRCWSVAVVMLFIVLIPGLGHVVNGSRRWIRVLGFNFQASELARVLTLIFIASYAVRREEELRSTAFGLIKPMLLLGFIALLLLAEPDFGAASVLLMAGFGILFVAGARLRYVLLVAAACAGALSLLVLLVPYRMARVTSFLDPWADPFNSGFQLTQSLIAIGRGEWFGVGLGESVQKLFYLPEAHTDFLFAVLAEELGLVGVAATLALFIGLVWRSFWIAQLASRANLKFQAYLAAGFGIWLGSQALINIGVNMGVLPTKGLTLPLMSYGRSSMIVTLAWWDCCCVCITRPCRARAAWPRCVARKAMHARWRRGS